jgi:ATP-binding cassette, subfamily B, bacterial
MPKLKRAILLVWQSAPRLTGIKVALIILQGILPLASLYLTKVVVDTLSASLTTPNQEAAFSQIMVLLAIAGIVILATTLCESSAN